MFYDNPHILYENPPPPSKDFEYDNEPIVFKIHKPRIVKGLNIIKIDRSLINLNVHNFNEKGERINSTDTDCLEKRKKRSLPETVCVEKPKQNLTQHENTNDNTNIESINTETGLNTLEEKIERRKLEKIAIPESFDCASNDYYSNTFHNFNEKGERINSTDTDCLEKRKKRSLPETVCIEKPKQNLTQHENTNDNTNIESINAETGLNTLEEKIERKKLEKIAIPESFDYASNDYYSNTFHGFNEKDEKQNFTDTDCLEKREKRSLPETVCTEKSKQNLTQKHKNTKDNTNIESINVETGLNTLEEKIERRKLKKIAIPESFDYASNDYYCNVCKINLYSLAVYSAHMKGKRHKKAVKLLTERQLHKTPVLEVIEPKTHTRQTEIVRIKLHGQESKIQNLCDDADLPILGLNYVKEIRGSEIKYHCDLCSAQFIEKKIMDHLVGIEHQMNCLKKYSPQIYRWIKHHSHDSRRVEKELKLRLEEIKIDHGIGQIRVFKDVERKPVSPEPYDPYQPSTSRHGLNVPEQNAEYVGRSNELRVTDEECLSRDYSDFYCKVCDSHMNTYSTWESHVSGKRHSKNKTKSSKGIEKTNNFIKAPYGTISHLEQLITDQCDTDAIIVGLNFIQENHGEIGNQYNCYLCGGVYPGAEIINHLNLLKHKQRYLEKMFDDGHNNAINNIKSLRIGKLSKEALIDSECITMLKEFGSGKPIIYQLKDF